MSIPVPVLDRAGFRPAHFFSVLQGAVPTETADEEAGPFFQPLFRCASGNGASRSEADRAVTENFKERLALARQAQFDRGAADGRQEAFCMARSAMAPELQQTLDSLRAAAGFQETVCAAMATQIIALAVHISERILTTEIDSSPSRIDALRNRLLASITDYYRMQLSIGSGQLDRIRDLCDCLGLEWAQYSTICIPEERKTNASEHSKPSDSEISKLEEIVVSLFATCKGGFASTL
jgi:hypothetical protein